MFSKEIKQSIIELSNVHGAHALKASFEDEGVSDSDLTDLILLSGDSGLEVYVKIGGCEANRDIEKCLRLGISGLVAPMVESSFAVSKFIASTENKCRLLSIETPKKFINIETLTAVSNVEEILHQHHSSLDGIVVGRSDLSKSMGLQKSNVNDKEVIENVSRTLACAKKYNLKTKMGGTVSNASVPIIQELFAQGLLDRFETRAVIFDLNRVKDISSSIKSALRYEQMLLKKRMTFHSAKSNFYDQRINNIEGRK